MDEDTEKRSIETLTVVSTVSFHKNNVTHKTGYRTNLRYLAVSSYGVCDVIDYLRELGQRIQRDHGPMCVHAKLKIIQERAAQVNKTALETEKTRDELHKQIEQIEQWLHPKRALTDDDAGDGHEMLAEVDNWDL